MHLKFQKLFTKNLIHDTKMRNTCFSLYMTQQFNVVSISEFLTSKPIKFLMHLIISPFKLPNGWE